MQKITIFRFYSMNFFISSEFYISKILTKKLLKYDPIKMKTNPRNFREIIQLNIRFNKTDFVFGSFLHETWHGTKFKLAVSSKAETCLEDRG